MFLVNFVPKDRFDSCLGENVEPKPDVSRRGPHDVSCGSAGILPGPREMMTLAMVPDNEGGCDMLLFCLDGLTVTSWAFCVGLSP